MSAWIDEVPSESPCQIKIRRPGGETKWSVWFDLKR